MSGENMAQKQTDDTINQFTIIRKQYPPLIDLIYNPPLTPDNIELVHQAVHLLSNNPKMTNHPIRRFLHDSDFKAKFRIVFDNYFARIAASATDTAISILSGENIAYYLKTLAHEFIHVAIFEKYISNNNYFLLCRSGNFLFGFIR